MRVGRGARVNQNHCVNLNVKRINVKPWSGLSVRSVSRMSVWLYGTPTRQTTGGVAGTRPHHAPRRVAGHANWGPLRGAPILRLRRGWGCADARPHPTSARGHDTTREDGDGSRRGERTGRDPRAGAGWARRHILYSLFHRFRNVHRLLAIATRFTPLPATGTYPRQ